MDVPYKGLNPLEIGSNCNLFRAILTFRNTNVSIPLKSGLIVIKVWKWNKEILISCLNPLEIGSNCNKNKK